MFLHPSVWGFDRSEGDIMEFIFTVRCDSRSEWESRRKNKFLYSLVPTKSNSLSPSGAICVTHEAPPPPLLASGLRVRHDSHAKAAARITPKTSAAPLMPPWERLWSLMRPCTLNHISGKILARQANHAWKAEIVQDHHLCVTRKRPSSDLETLLGEYSVSYL